MNRYKFNENIEVVQNSRNVITVYFKGVSAGWEFPILLSSDEHFDSPFCNRTLMKSHLEDIKQQGGMVFKFGDLFDAMQGKHDPRRNPAELRPEYKVENYFDEVVTDCAKFHSPYSKNIVLMSPGNHEDDVLTNNGTDLISNTIYRLNSDTGSHIFEGCYGGYVRFMFDSGRHESKILKYFHGARMGFSRGQVNFQGAIYPDADIVVNGHAHDAWYVPVAREHITQRANVERTIQHHVRTSTYKDDYGDGANSYPVKKGLGPGPNGAVLLKFYLDNHKIELDITQKVR